MSDARLALIISAFSPVVGFLAGTLAAFISTTRSAKFALEAQEKQHAFELKKAEDQAAKDEIRARLDALNTVRSHLMMIAFLLPELDRFRSLAIGVRELEAGLHAQSRLSEIRDTIHDHCLQALTSAQVFDHQGEIQVHAVVAALVEELLGVNAATQEQCYKVINWLLKAGIEVRYQKPISPFDSEAESKALEGLKSHGQSLRI